LNNTGILLQHHTASLVHPSIPSGWEEEMTYGVGEKPRGGTKRRKGGALRRRMGKMRQGAAVAAKEC